jgi:hypothetical protein
VVGGLVQHEEVRLLHQLLGEQELAQFAGAHIVAIEQPVGV